jgi:hypothetical protein
MRNTPTKRYVQIREMLVDAITAARKAHLSEVVFKLRAALLQSLWQKQPKANAEFFALTYGALNCLGGKINNVRIGCIHRLLATNS